MDDPQVLREVTITLDGRQVTQAQLNEAINSLPKDKKIVETSPGSFSTKTVLHG